MKLPATQLSLTPDSMVLKTEMDGRVQPGTEVRRSSSSLRREGGLDRIGVLRERQ